MQPGMAVAIIIVLLILCIGLVYEFTRMMAPATVPVASAPATSTTPVASSTPTSSTTPSATPLSAPVVTSIPVSFPSSTPAAPTPAPASPISYVGCYKDSSARAMPGAPNPPIMTIDNCVAAAKAAGAKYIGMQYPQGAPAGSGQAYCFYGSDTGYSKYGTTTTCSNQSDSQGRDLGWTWANSVYKLN